LATKKDANGNSESNDYDAYQRMICVPDRRQSFTYDTCTPNAAGMRARRGRITAMNRYCASRRGRFLSPDPYTNSVGLRDPGSWNRYAYGSCGPYALRAGAAPAVVPTW